LKLHEIDLTDGAVLETNCVYIVRCVHPRDCGRHAAVRHDRRGLPWPALC
jgi:hypothetical protein